MLVDKYSPHILWLQIFYRFLRKMYTKSIHMSVFLLMCVYLSLSKITVEQAAQKRASDAVQERSGTCTYNMA